MAEPSQNYTYNYEYEHKPLPVATLPQEEGPSLNGPRGVIKSS
jgi:hypothetical protein